MGDLLHRTVTPMTGTSGMVYFRISARWNISHASVQVLGGTGLIGAHGAPSRRTSWRRSHGWKRIFKSRAGPCSFFAQRACHEFYKDSITPPWQTLLVGTNSRLLRPRTQKVAKYPGRRHAVLCSD